MPRQSHLALALPVGVTVAVVGVGAARVAVARHADVRLTPLAALRVAAVAGGAHLALLTGRVLPAVLHGQARSDGQTVRSPDGQV